MPPFRKQRSHREDTRTIPPPKVSWAPRGLFRLRVGRINELVARRARARGEIFLNRREGGDRNGGGQREREGGEGGKSEKPEPKHAYNNS